MWYLIIGCIFGVFASIELEREQHKDIPWYTKFYILLVAFLIWPVVAGSLLAEFYKNVIENNDEGTTSE